MNNLRILFSRLLVMVFCLLILRVVHAAQPTGVGPPPTDAECDAMLEVTPSTDMDFGSFVGGASGTIVMDATGAMIHTGVVPVGGAAGTPATFNLVAPGKNCDKVNYFLNMPNSITISDGNSGTLTITNLVSDLSTNPFRVKEVQQIKIGGTLTVTTGAAQASYTGPFDVTFTF